MSEAAPKPASRPPIDVADDFGFDLSHFSIPEHYRPDLANVMLPHGLISDRAQRMAEDIYSDYDFANGARLHMLCVLKGGHEFFSDLIMHLKKLLTTGCKHVPIGFDFIRVKSYSNMESSGKPKIEATGTGLALPEFRALVKALKAAAAAAPAAVYRLNVAGAATSDLPW